jgi:hypothetical protein
MQWTLVWLLSRKVSLVLPENKTTAAGHQSSQDRRGIPSV